MSFLAVCRAIGTRDLRTRETAIKDITTKFHFHQETSGQRHPSKQSTRPAQSTRYRNDTTKQEGWGVWGERKGEKGKQRKKKGGGRGKGRKKSTKDVGNGKMDRRSSVVGAVRGRDRCGLYVQCSGSVQRGANEE